MNLITFNRGNVIFRQGDFAHGMYDILSGSVGIYVGYGTEHEVELNVLKAGDYLGEMGMIEVYPRSATASRTGRSSARSAMRSLTTTSRHSLSACLRSCASSASACATERRTMRLPAKCWKA